MKDTFLFDLDGTIMDSKYGIVSSFRHCFKYAYEKTKRSEFLLNTDEELLQFVGPSLDATFYGYCKCNEEEHDEFIKVFRAYYREKGIYDAKVFEGIKEVLEFLHSKGKRLVVCTSKFEEMAYKVLDHFDLTKYFTLIVGSLDEVRNTKDLVIKEAIRALDIDKEKAIMIGDKIYDIEESKINGIESIGCLFGYGSLEEFKEATYKVNSTKELLELVSKLCEEN